MAQKRLFKVRETGSFPVDVFAVITLWDDNKPKATPFEVNWVSLGNGLSPCLDMFDDAWGYLKEWPDLFISMAARVDQDATVSEFKLMLENLGFTEVPENLGLEVVDG